MEQNSIYLSIVIPAYNEEPNIYSTLKDIAGYLKDKAYKYELILVDDGSRDKTVEIAESSRILFSQFTV